MAHFEQASYVRSGDDVGTDRLADEVLAVARSELQPDIVNERLAWSVATLLRELALVAASSSAAQVPG